MHSDNNQNYLPLHIQKLLQTLSQANPINIHDITNELTQYRNTDFKIDKLLSELASNYINTDMIEGDDKTHIIEILERLYSLDSRISQTKKPNPYMSLLRYDNQCENTEEINIRKPIPLNKDSRSNSLLEMNHNLNDFSLSNLSFRNMNPENSMLHSLKNSYKILHSGTQIPSPFNNTKHVSNFNPDSQCNSNIANQLSVNAARNEQSPVADYRSFSSYLETHKQRRFSVNSSFMQSQAIQQSDEKPDGSKDNKQIFLTKKRKSGIFQSYRATSIGLKEISKMVLDILKQNNVTSYKYISDRIVRDCNIDEKEESNIRRRIYDALNVMSAMNIFRKDKKDKSIVYEPDSEKFHLKCKSHNEILSSLEDEIVSYLT